MDSATTLGISAAWSHGLTSSNKKLKLKLRRHKCCGTLETDYYILMWAFMDKSSSSVWTSKNIAVNH